jgi:hypothetical protein
VKRELEIRTEFILVDLQSQRAAVAEYVRGWDMAQVLAWMRQYGEVIEPDQSNHTEIYCFKSASGQSGYFHLTQETGLIILDSGWLA